MPRDAEDRADNLESGGSAGDERRDGCKEFHRVFSDINNEVVAATVRIYSLERSMAVAVQEQG